MYSFGHIRSFAFGLPLLVAVVCALFSFGWGACTTSSTPLFSLHLGSRIDCYYGSASHCGGEGYRPLCSNTSVCSGGCQSVYNNNGVYYYDGRNRGASMYWCNNSSNSSCGSISSQPFCDYYASCTTQAEADSALCLNSGSLWIDGVCCDEQCVCEKNGGQWVNGECNSCNDHVPMPDKCEELWQSGYSVDGEGNAGGGGYWAIVTYECFYDSCAMSLNCQEKSNFPAGSLNCGDFMDSTGTTGRCVGVVGFQCVMQCGTVTKNCDCDGSCQKALDTPDCACPKSSSSSGDASSSSGDASSSSADVPTSSGGVLTSSGSGSGSGSDDWEYDYTPKFNELISLNASQVGYLSDIDKIVANINANGLKVDVSGLEAAATQELAAQKAGNDTLHSIHWTLDRIDSALTQEVETPDISDWLTSATSVADELYSKARDTTTIKVHIDSLKADTSNFKSKYSGLFITNAYTRDGCYTFTIKDSGLMGKVGHQFKLGASVNFGDLGGWDLCAILRGVVRAIGAILCLLITIKAYRSAFSSSDG